MSNHDPDDAPPATFGERLSLAMREAGIASNSELARRVNVTRNTVKQWRDGVTGAKGDNLLAVARAVGRSADWLEYGREYGVKPPADGRRYPVISAAAPPEAPAAADALREKTSGSFAYAGARPGLPSLGGAASAAPRYYRRDYEDGAKTFVIISDDDALSGHTGDIAIPKGSAVFLDPQRTPSHGDVVAYTFGDDPAIRLRRYRTDGDDIYLCPLNPDFNIIRPDGRYRIIAVALRFERSLLG